MRDFAENARVPSSLQGCFVGVRNHFRGALTRRATVLRKIFALHLGFWSGKTDPCRRSHILAAHSRIQAFPAPPHERGRIKRSVRERRRRRFAERRLASTLISLDGH